MLVLFCKHNSLFLIVIWNIEPYRARLPQKEREQWVGQAKPNAAKCLENKIVNETNENKNIEIYIEGKTDWYLVLGPRYSSSKCIVTYILWRLFFH